MDSSYPDNFCPQCQSYLKKELSSKKKICQKCGWREDGKYQTNEIPLNNFELENQTKAVIRDADVIIKKEWKKIEIPSTNDLTDIERQYYIQLAKLKFKENHIKPLENIYRRLLERISIEVAMGFERYSGRKPEDRSHQKWLGYDLISIKEGDNARYIEVKGSIKSGNNMPSIILQESEYNFLSGYDLMSKYWNELMDRRQEIIQELKKRWMYVVILNRESLLEGKELDVKIHTISQEKSNKIQFNEIGKFGSETLSIFYEAKFWKPFSDKWMITPSECVKEICLIMKNIILKEKEEKIKNLLIKKANTITKNRKNRTS